MESALTTVPPKLVELANLYGREPVLELVDIFLSSGSQLVDSIENAFRDNDFQKLGSQAHSLKSSSAALGATALSEICRQLEKSGPSETTVQLMEKLRSEWPLTFEALRSWRSAQK